MLRHRTPALEIFDEIHSLQECTNHPQQCRPWCAKLPGLVAQCLLALGGNIGLCAIDAVSRHPGDAVTSYEPRPRIFEYSWGALRVMAPQPGRSLRRVRHRSAVSSTLPAVALRRASTASRLPDSIPSLYRRRSFTNGYRGKRVADSRRPALVGSNAHCPHSFSSGTNDICPSAHARENAISRIVGAGFPCEASPSGWDHGTICGWRARGRGSTTARLLDQPQVSQQRMRERAANCARACGGNGPRRSGSRGEDPDASISWHSSRHVVPRLAWLEPARGGTGFIRTRSGIAPPSQASRPRFGGTPPQSASQCFRAWPRRLPVSRGRRSLTGVTATDGQAA